MTHGKILVGESVDGVDSHAGLQTGGLAMRGQREEHAAVVSVGGISRALLTVFASAVTVGYLAGLSFRPSPAPTAPKLSPVRRYAAVGTPVPQSTVIHMPVPGRPAPLPAWPLQPQVPLVPERRFNVQVRVYQGPIEAEAVARELRRRGYAICLGSGAPTIQVGGDLDRPAAERLIKRLSGEGFVATLAAP
jgi:hypothetical protein